PPAAGDHQHPVALVGDDHTDRGAAAALHGFGGGHTGCAPFWSWAPAPRSLSTAVGQGSRRFVVDRAVPPPALPRGRADRGNTRIRGSIRPSWRRTCRWCGCACPTVIPSWWWWSTIVTSAPVRPGPGESECAGADGFARPRKSVDSMTYGKESGGRILDSPARS